MKEKLEAKIKEYNDMLKETKEQQAEVKQRLEDLNKSIERITGALIATQELLKDLEPKDSDQAVEAEVVESGPNTKKKK